MSTPDNVEQIAASVVNALGDGSWTSSLGLPPTSSSSIDTDKRDNKITIPSTQQVSAAAAVPTTVSPNDEVESSGRRQLGPAPFHYYRDFSREEDPDPLTPLTLPGRVPAFPAKMHAILSRRDLSDVVAWMPHGRSWRVLKPREFEVRVIPTYFEHSKFSSFIRQANGWGFRRVTQGRDRNTYYHELFLRGLPHLCKKMKRPGVAEKSAADADHEPDFYKISEMYPVPEGSNDESILLQCTVQGGPKARMPIYSGSYLSVDQVKAIRGSVTVPIAAPPMSMAPVAHIAPPTIHQAQHQQHIAQPVAVQINPSMTPTQFNPATMQINPTMQMTFQGPDGQHYPMQPSQFVQQHQQHQQVVQQQQQSGNHQQHNISPVIIFPAGFAPSNMATTTMAPQQQASAPAPTAILPSNQVTTNQPQQHHHHPPPQQQQVQQQHVQQQTLQPAPLQQQQRQVQQQNLQPAPLQQQQVQQQQAPQQQQVATNYVHQQAPPAPQQQLAPVPQQHQQQQQAEQQQVTYQQQPPQQQQDGNLTFQPPPPTNQQFAAGFMTATRMGNTQLRNVLGQAFAAAAPQPSCQNNSNNI